MFEISELEFKPRKTALEQSYRRFKFKALCLYDNYTQLKIMVIAFNKTVPRFTKCDQLFLHCIKSIVSIFQQLLTAKIMRFDAIRFPWCSYVNKHGYRDIRGFKRLKTNICYVIAEVSSKMCENVIENCFKSIGY